MSICVHNTLQIKVVSLCLIKHHTMTCVDSWQNMSFRRKNYSKCIEYKQWNCVTNFNNKLKHENGPKNPSEDQTLATEPSLF
jgi:hypothetical protein